MFIIFLPSLSLKNLPNIPIKELKFRFVMNLDGFSDLFSMVSQQPIIEALCAVCILRYDDLVVSAYGKYT